MVARFPGTTSHDLAVLHGYALPLQLYPGLLPQHLLLARRPGYEASYALWHPLGVPSFSKV